ncbi:flagellin N-terminal-like domain protein [Streptomyces turgidiscabies Car8]|uniref:Flagellin N-terminal-like domain protein n=1 Tax=Streptomyces turgidiscabies (strain Car8) TaxID=698760 RepID=L7EWC7_STRT8|nr:flagellin N-terminal-like domain protein [Streptomyces turgidiscabies Car8]
MIRSRPGSVVAAARNWSTPSAKAVRRGGWGTPGAEPLPPCEGMAGRAEAAGVPDTPDVPGPSGESGVGGAALLVAVTVTSPMVIRHRQYRPRH